METGKQDMEDKVLDAPPPQNDEFDCQNADPLMATSSSVMAPKESGTPLHLQSTPNPLAAPIPSTPAESPQLAMASSSSLIMRPSSQGSENNLMCSTLEEGPPLKKLKLQSRDFAVSVGLRESVSKDTTPKPNTSETAATESDQSANHVSSASGTSASEGSTSTTSLEPTNPGSPVGQTNSPKSPTSIDDKAEERRQLSSSSVSPREDALLDDAIPIKVSKMVQLRSKYSTELEYMLKEFRKLERQLLGATGTGVPIKESEGSRVRRDKLHSFILHLEDTIRQVELGCQLEAEGKTTVMVGVTVGEGSTSVAAMASDNRVSTDEAKQALSTSSALSRLSREKEEEENVQKLEEHILGNLLPVKQRLTKQLAAQQGASRNPVGMPVSRRGMLQPATGTDQRKGTFAAAAEQKRKRLEASKADSDETQFGKPIVGGASSLTQKLHGSTLGSKNRKFGHGVGSSEGTEGDLSTDGDSRLKKQDVLFAGMAHGSNQRQSGMSAASSVHKVAFETTALLPPPSPTIEPSKPGSSDLSRTPVVPDAKTMAARHAAAARAAGLPVKAPGASLPVPVPVRPLPDPEKNRTNDTSAISDTDERKKLKRKKKRKKQRHDAKARERERHMQIIRQQQTAQGKSQGKRGKGNGAKGQGKKKGPRSVEYICALCSETYASTCDANPWWSLSSHDCPKCRKTQVPRVDISARANQIEYHPALLAHAEEGNAAGASHGGSMSVMQINPAHLHPHSVSRKAQTTNSSDSDSDLSDISLAWLSDDSTDGSDLDFPGGLTPADHAENEEFGNEYTGPTFSEYESARLLVLMEHASSCPGRHRQLKQRDVCRSVKYLMLHARDCPGTTATFDVCPFPWCRKVKHLMYHLVSCSRSGDCTICSPPGLSPSLRTLIGLGQHRRKKMQERRARAMAAAAAAARAAPSSMSRVARKVTGARDHHRTCSQYELSQPNAPKPGGAKTACAATARARAAAGYQPPNAGSTSLSRRTNLRKQPVDEASIATLDAVEHVAHVSTKVKTGDLKVAHTRALDIVTTASPLSSDDTYSTAAIVAAEDTVDSVLTTEQKPNYTTDTPMAVSEKIGASREASQSLALPRANAIPAKKDPCEGKETPVIARDNTEQRSSVTKCGMSTMNADSVVCTHETEGRPGTREVNAESNRGESRGELPPERQDELANGQEITAEKEDVTYELEGSSLAPVAEKATSCSEEVATKQEAVRMSY